MTAANLELNLDMNSYHTKFKHNQKFQKRKLGKTNKIQIEVSWQTRKKKGQRKKAPLRINIKNSH